MWAGESKYYKLEEEGEAAQRGGGKTQSGEGQSAPATPPDVGMKPVEEEEEG